MADQSPTTRAGPRVSAQVVRPRRQNADPYGVWPNIQSHNEALVLALQFQFEASQWWPEERLLANQLRQVEHLIEHARTTVPFYADRLAALPKGRLTMEAFREIPFLLRREIQGAGEALMTTKLPKEHGNTIAAKTSGSTGEPVELLATDLTSTFTNAFTMRGHIWHRRDLSQKNVDIRTWYEGNKAPKRSRWAALVKTGPSIRLDLSRPMSELLDDLVREDPAYLQTRPYTLLGLVERSLETGTKPQKLKEVRTFGEVLRPHIREMVETHWRVPVVDNYSAIEIATIAHQCPKTTNLHIMSEGVLVEVLDDDGRPCGPGQVGRVVVTALHNYATPLIRYALGDYAEVAAPCLCKRGLPALARVMGRSKELMLYPNGDRRFPDPLLHTLRPEIPIQQYQLVQTSVQDVDVNLVVGRALSAGEEARIRTTLTERLHHEFSYDLNYMDDIPRTPGGKFEAFRSELIEDD